MVRVRVIMLLVIILMLSKYITLIHVVIRITLLIEGRDLRQLQWVIQVLNSDLWSYSSRLLSYILYLSISTLHTFGALSCRRGFLRSIFILNLERWSLNGYIWNILLTRNLTYFDLIFYLNAWIKLQISNVWDYLVFSAYSFEKRRLLWRLRERSLLSRFSLLVLHGWCSSHTSLKSLLRTARCFGKRSLAWHFPDTWNFVIKLQ